MPNSTISDQLREQLVSDLARQAQTTSTAPPDSGYLVVGSEPNYATILLDSLRIETPPQRTHKFTARKDNLCEFCEKHYKQHPEGMKKTFRDRFWGTSACTCEVCRNMALYRDRRRT